MDEPKKILYKSTIKHNIFEFEPYFLGQAYDGKLWAEIVGCLEDELIPKEFEYNIELTIIFLEQLKEIISLKKNPQKNNFCTDILPQSIINISELIKNNYNNFFQQKVPYISEEVYISAVVELIDQKISFHEAILNYFYDLENKIDQELLPFIDKVAVVLQKKIKVDSCLLWKHIGALYDLNFIQIHFFLQIINNRSTQEIEKLSLAEPDKIRSLLNFDLLLKLYITNDMKSLAQQFHCNQTIEYEKEILKKAAGIYNQFKTFKQPICETVPLTDTRQFITDKDLIPFFNINYLSPVGETFFPDMIVILNGKGVYRGIFLNDKATLNKWNITLQHIIATTNYQYLLRLDPLKLKSFIDLDPKDIEDILLHDKVIELSSQIIDTKSFKLVSSYYNYSDHILPFTGSLNSSFDENDYNSLD
jgi:hypothetical protein